MSGIVKMTLSPATVKEAIQFWLNCDVVRADHRCRVMEARPMKDGGLRIVIVPPDWRMPDALAVATQGEVTMKRA
jgi:hypothetical protein